MQSNIPINIGFNVIKIIEASLALDSMDDLLEMTLAQLLQIQHVRQAKIYLFNKKNNLVLAASARNTGPWGNEKQNIRVQCWNIDSARRHSTRRSNVPAPFLEYIVPLIQSNSLLGFLNVYLDQNPIAANDLKANLYLVALNLSIKIKELRLHEAIRNLQDELQNVGADNRQNLQRITALSKELYAICAISTKINQSMDLKKSLRKSMLKIKEVFRALGVIVYLRNPGRSREKIKTVRLENEQLDPALLDRITTIVEQGVEKTRPALKNRFSTRFSQPRQVDLNSDGGESIAIVPMTLKKKYVGILVIVLRPMSFFNQENLRLLSGIANIMAMAIDNMYLYHKSQQKEKESAFLVHSILKFNENLDLKLTLKSIAEKGAEFIGMRCRVYLFSETRIPMVQHIRPKKRELNAAQSMAFGRIEPEALKNFYEQIKQQKRPSLIADVNRTRKMKQSLKKYFLDKGVHSVIAVPLRLASKPVGLLLLGSLEGRHAFDFHELRVAEALGIGAAVAIENVRAYDASVEMSEFLEKKIGEKTNQIQRIQERQKIRVENRKDIIFRVSRTNRFVFVNKAMEELTGCSREDLYQEDIGADAVVAVEDREHVRDGFRKILKQELAMIKDLEYRHINRKGEDHFISLTIYPETDRNGQITGVEGVGRDITQKKRLEAELEKTKDLALLGEFSSAIAHQIRNPLGNILVGTELLQMALGLNTCDSTGFEKTRGGLNPISPSREKLTEISQNLSDGIYNLNQVVTKLVEYTKTLKLHRTCQPIDIILNEILATFEDMISQKRIHVDTCFDAALPALSVDAVLIGQVFRNIIHNAIQAVHEGGRLIVTAGIYPRKSTTAMISIADSGIGIDPGDLERIFRPFYTTKDSGIGLGLSLAHRIIDAHGGRIWACSNPCHHTVTKGVGCAPLIRPQMQGLTVHIQLPMDDL